jgi:adenylate kinase
MPNIVLLGAPGSGKGTQAGALARALGVIHLATGDLFRENLSQRTPLGLLAKGYMDRGDYVPDDVTVSMVFDRLEQPDATKGAVFDGFPRTLPQAEALDSGLAERKSSISKAIYLVVSDAELVRRLSGRWLCRNCGAPYNQQDNPPRKRGVCDSCGGELYQRDDDKPEVVATRLMVFKEQTLPLIAYYKAQDKLVEVNGEGDIDTIGAALLRAANGSSA